MYEASYRRTLDVQCTVLYTVYRLYRLYLVYSCTDKTKLCVNTQQQVNNTNNYVYKTVAKITDTLTVTSMSQNHWSE